MIQKILYHIKNGGLKELIAISYRFLLIHMAPVLMRVFGLFKVRHRIVFSHFDGKAYGGNPGAICDEILNQSLPYKVIWITDKKYKDALPRTVKWVPTYSIRQFWALATSKVWVDDCRKASCIRKRNKQYYIQTWHGGGPCLKKVEADAIEDLPDSYIKDAKNDSLMVDMLVSACRWRTNNYRAAFWYDGEILKCGSPTEDIYARNPNEIIDEVYKDLGIGREKKIVLYAPTFRSVHNLKPYEMDLSTVLETIQMKFGGEWCFVIRLHPAIMNLSETIHYTDVILNGSLFPRFEDLVIASDILITDYSGCMFSAYMLKKKVFIYATDLEKYSSNERGFYFNIEDLPAPVSTTSDGLINCIKGFDLDFYIQEVDSLNNEIGYYSFGKSTKSIVNRIIKVMEER